MRLIRKLRLLFRTLFLRSRVENDLTDELRDYIEREVEREIAAGSSPDDARRIVRRAMQGGEQRLKEECRDARGTRWIEDAVKDLRFALRTMRRTPAFTVTVVTALAFCIGANTAIFSVVDTVLFRPLPFPQQDRLVSATEGIPSAGFPIMPYSCPDYLFVAANNRSFESTATYKTELYEISEVGRPRRAKGARVNASLFHVLGIDPVIGRTFTKEEDENSKPVAVLSYGFARCLFGTPESALGRTIHVDRKPYTVIGVMPPSFSFPPRGLRFNGDPAELFIPVSWSKHDREDMANSFNYSMIARLRPGVSLQQAAAELRALLKRMPENYPPDIKNYLKELPNFSLESQVMSFREEVSGNVRRPLLVLLAAVGVVLLIGCADVANLMFSRLVGRQREFALRAALGAGTWRLARQTITEGLLLSTVGGVAGFVLSFSALSLLLHFAPDNLPRLDEVGLNWRVATFVIVVTLSTPLFFCLAPLADLLRSGVAERLHGAGRTGTQSRRQRLVMSGTVVLQFSLAFVLLTSAGLLVRSFIKASEANPGFRPEHVVSLRISLPDVTYAKSAQVTSFYDSLLETVASLPGVQQTGAVSDLPMGFSDNGIVSAEGRAGTERQETIFCAGDALGTLRTPLVRGRLLQPQDGSNKQSVAVVSETLARRLWPEQDPLGRHIKFGVKDNPLAPWMTVVGIVRDVKDRQTSTSPRPMIFATTSISKHNDMNIIVRTTDDPLAIVSAIRRAVKDLDPRLPVEDVQTLTQVLDQSLSPERFRTYLLAAFAVVALLLAILGIGGLLLYSTAQRAQEFGVRMALGADRRDLLLLVLRQSLKLSATGIAIGLAASVLVTGALSSLLYDTSQYDVTTFVGVPVVLALVALGASAFPAWKAVHTDPIAALKAE